MLFETDPRGADMAFVDSSGIQIYYEDRGEGEPALLCLPGWCVHHTVFLPLVERLSTRHRVLAADWRGHGRSQTSNRDFGYAEMLDDVLAVIEASGAHNVVPITQAHGGWIAIELRRRLGERVPKMAFASWNPIFTNQNPMAHAFMDAMEALQDQERWRDAVERLFAIWLADAPASLDAHIRDEMGSHGFEDWSRAAREITGIYGREGDPLQVLTRLDPPAPALHVYSQPQSPEYLSTQMEFARENSWFSVHRLPAVSHFPTLEMPDKTARVISDFLRNRAPN